MMYATATATAPEPVRNEQIRHYYPMVRQIAQRLHARLPRCVELDDLIAAGVEGLIEAIDRYECDRSVPFAAYARHRIHGAIVDALRATDWVPRSVRRKATRLDQARRQLVDATGTEPGREAMAAALGVPTERYDAMAQDAAVRTLVSLEAPLQDDEGSSLRDRVAADGEDLLERWQEEERRQMCVEAIEGLPERERTAISLYYLHELSLKEVGQVLGVTESRACQLRSAGVKRLRLRLAAQLG